MARFFIRRLLSLVPTLFIIITLSFFLIRVAPGGPFNRERTCRKPSSITSCSDTTWMSRS